MRKATLMTIFLAAGIWFAIPHWTSDEVTRETLTTVCPAPTSTPQVVKPRPKPKPHVVAVPKPLDSGQIALKARVEAEFIETPEMSVVVRCESKYRQFDASGNPLESVTGDWGLTQINAKTWDARAKAEGLDYKHSVDDNIAMAKIVLKEQGITAWTCYRLTR